MTTSTRPCDPGPPTCRCTNGNCSAAPAHLTTAAGSPTPPAPAAASAPSGSPAPCTPSNTPPAGSSSTRHTTTDMPDGVIYKALRQPPRLRLPILRRDLPRRRLPTHPRRPRRRQRHPRHRRRTPGRVRHLHRTLLRARPHPHASTRPDGQGPARAAPRREPRAAAPTAVDLVCHRATTTDDARSSAQPLCLDCYDHDHQVVWNCCAGELWRRTMITPQTRRSAASQRAARRQAAGVLRQGRRIPSAAASSTSTPSSASTASTRPTRTRTRPTRGITAATTCADARRRRRRHHSASAPRPTPTPRTAGPSPGARSSTSGPSGHRRRPEIITETPSPATSPSTPPRPPKPPATPSRPHHRRHHPSTTPTPTPTSTGSSTPAGASADPAPT